MMKWWNGEMMKWWNGEMMKFHHALPIQMVRWKGSSNPPPSLRTSSKISRIHNWWSKWPKITTFHKVKKFVDLGKNPLGTFWGTFFQKSGPKRSKCSKGACPATFQLLCFSVPRLLQLLKTRKNTYLTTKKRPWTLQIKKVKKVGKTFREIS